MPGAVPRQGEHQRQHDDVRGDAERVEFARGDVLQAALAEAAPGDAEGAGGERDGHAGPGSGAALEQAERRGDRHGDQRRHGAEEQAGHAQQHRPGVEHDAAFEPEGGVDQRHAQAAEKHADGDLPQGAPVRPLPAGGEIENDDQRQQQSGVIQQGDEGRIVHGDRRASSTTGAYASASAPDKRKTAARGNSWRGRNGRGGRGVGLRRGAEGKDVISSSIRPGFG